MFRSEKSVFLFQISEEIGQPCEFMEEENYMFPLHKFRESLKKWIKSKVNFHQLICDEFTYV